MDQFVKIAPFIGLLVVLIGVIYFLNVRPEKKRKQDQNMFLNKLKKGDKVVTIGGIHGTVYSISDATVILNLETGAKIKIDKLALSKFQ